MTVKKTLILKIFVVEILAVFFGWFIREQGRGFYFSVGLIPPAPLWVYDVLAPVALSVAFGFVLGLGVFLEDYWAQVEKRQWLAAMKRKIELTEEVTEEAKA